MIRITADLRETVIAIARQAGAAIMEIYAGSFDVAHKDDASPLTAADLAAHRIIVEGLERIRHGRAERSNRNNKARALREAGRSMGTAPRRMAGSPQRRIRMGGMRAP